MMKNIDAVKNIRLFLFDMDGTLYIGNRLFDFTKELLERIRESGSRYLFMTNNSSKSVDDYVQKLKGLGIDADREDFITSSQATALYLKENRPNDRLYVCGTQSLKKELSDEGFTITESIEDTDCIVMGFDTELNFKKLEDVCKILLTKNVGYIATNPDLVCPTEYGSVPDCGSVCEMIYNATKMRPIVIGKPQPEMPLIAMKKYGVDKAETAVIGDRIYTDIKSGIAAGALSILVMSGECDKLTLDNSDVKPDLVIDSAKEILDILKS